MQIDKEAKLRAEASRGQRAAEIMADELVVEAFTKMRDRFASDWANSPARDTEGREKIWLMQKLLKSVEDQLKEVMTTGRMASMQLEQERTIAQRAKAAMQELLA